MNIEEYFNPFPGLRSFEEEEEYLFFGREKQIDELVSKLGKTKFLAVVGASGSGKSSLVKSGLLPSLHSGFMEGVSSGWRICTFRPGSDPIGNLSQALSAPEILGENDENNISPSIIESILRRNDKGVSEVLKQLSENHNQNILIVVDQFEELFRFSKYEKAEHKGTRDSVTFINLLLAAAKSSGIPIYVVFTMRSDFLGDCTEFRGLPEAINEGQYLIPRMTREERKVAITGPIAVGGAEISQSLLTRLLNDVGDNPDQLPILQHALMRTWEYWIKNSTADDIIDLVHYEAIGTMTKALSLHAEEAFFEIKDEKGQEICKKIFRSLTEKVDGGRGTRRPSQVKEICELAEINISEVASVIDVFRKPGRSFLMPPIETKLVEDTVIDISHESLMRVWERLIFWVNEEIESAELYTRLAQSAALYQEGKTGLWRDPELQMAVNWKANQKPNAVWAKRYDPSFDRAINFLDYSQLEKEKEIKGAEKKRKAAIFSLRVFISVITIAFIFSVYFGIDASNKEQVAVEEKQKADSLKTIANDQKQIALDSRKVADHQKQIAMDSTEAAVEQRKSAVKAKEEAVKAKEEAVEAKEEAVEAKEDAVKATKEAINAKEDAVKATKEAVRAKGLVDTLRLLAEAQNIAFKSNQLINNPERDTLSLQLAFLAYGINRKYNGPTQNIIIYEAFKNQLTKYYSKFKFDRQDLKFERGTYDLRTSVFINENEFIVSGDEGVFKRYKINKGPIELITEGSSKRFEEGFTNSIYIKGKGIFAGTSNGSIVFWDHTQPSSPIKPIYQGNEGNLGKSIFINVIENADNTISLYCGFERGIIELILENNSKISKKNLYLSSDSKIRAGVSYTKNKESYIYFSVNKSLYKLKNNQQKPELVLVYPEDISFIQVSNNSEYFALGGVNGNIIVYDNDTQHDVFFKVRGHISSISGLIFTADDATLISSSYDHSLISSNLIKDGETLVYKENRAWVRGLSLCKDGNYIVSVGQSGLIQVWPINLKTVLQEILGVKHYSEYLNSKTINKTGLEEELGKDLFKSISDLNKNGGIESFWNELQKKYLNK